MTVPFLDLKAQYRAIKPEILTSIGEVLESCSFVLGKPVESFERAFALAHNVKYCVGVSSGTDANHLSLHLLGIGPGDEVIIPANTFIATVWGATFCGATPVFADCEDRSYNIDPEALPRAIGPRTKAIVAVHLYGQPANLGRLKSIAQQQNIHLVEDAAQAHLAECDGRKIGSIGVTAAFSFYPGKNLGAYGEAGALTTNDETIAARARMFRDQGQSKKYHHDSFGHNYRMEAIQGAVLGVKLGHLAQWTELRRSVAKKYGVALSGIDGITAPEEMAYAKHVYHLYVVRARNRDRLKQFLEEKGIGTGLHYPIPLHLQGVFRHLGYKIGDFPVTEKAAAEILSLPIYPELTDSQIEYVASSIREFYRR